MRRLDVHHVLTLLVLASLALFFWRSTTGARLPVGLSFGGYVVAAGGDATAQGDRRETLARGDRIVSIAGRRVNSLAGIGDMLRELSLELTAPPFELDPNPDNALEPSGGSLDDPPPPPSGQEEDYDPLKELGQAPEPGEEEFGMPETGEEPEQRAPAGLANPGVAGDGGLDGEDEAGLAASPEMVQATIPVTLSRTQHRFTEVLTYEDVSQGFPNTIDGESDRVVAIDNVAVAAEMDLIALSEELARTPGKSRTVVFERPVHLYSVRLPLLPRQQRIWPLVLFALSLAVTIMVGWRARNDTE